MKIINVLITGCGGAVGIGVARALSTKRNELRLLGADSDPYSAVFYLNEKQSFLNRVFLLPSADSQDYSSEVAEICRIEKIDIVFPCTDSELEKLSMMGPQLSAYGTKVIISPANTIRICRDKWLTYNNLCRYLPIAKSAITSSGIAAALKFTGFPAVIKPRKGWGSRQTFIARNEEEAIVFLNCVTDPLIQKHFHGDEYTLDCLADSSGKVVCVVPRKRIKVSGGVSTESMTVNDPSLIDLGHKVAAHLKLIGPYNFQLIRSVEGPQIFEINARFAGTGILSVKAGVNIPFLAVRSMCGLDIPSEIAFEDGLVVSRYFDEVYFKNSEAVS